jgi:misacylated tRNA(Ala) deacylase
VNALYLQDCYLKEFESTIKSVKDGKFIVLNETAFYPSSGGQPYDKGTITRLLDNKVFSVVFVGKFDGDISHEVSEPGLSPGDKIIGKIDWERRHRLMRMHTAAHVLSRVLYEEAGAHTSGNQLDTEKSRIDFTLENLDREKIQGWIDKANSYIKQEIPVEIREITREQAQAELEGPSKHLMANLDVLRLVSIGSIDKQTCGGTHLKNIGEIGEIVLMKVENKGAKNRRIVYSLKP